MRIAVLNGPNLNLLGVREPEIYGRETLADVEARLRALAGELGVEVEFAQRNGEGELVDLIQQMRGRVDGALINAGAYSHTSLAIRDAFKSVSVPYVEVHIRTLRARAGAPPHGARGRRGRAAERLRHAGIRPRASRARRDTGPPWLTTAPNGSPRSARCW